MRRGADSEQRPPAERLPAAASSTPGTRRWGVWWTRPSRSRCGSCTLRRPWSWPCGRGGRWWLCTGLAFVPAAAAAWKQRGAIRAPQEDSPEGRPGQPAPFGDHTCSFFLWLPFTFVILFILSALGLHCCRGFSLVAESEGYSSWQRGGFHRL